MALDEAALETAIADGLALVRIYRWVEPTISLGYFQKEEDFRQLGELSRLPAVRRLSGGGAILHDQEWTYSVVLPPSHALLADPLQIYELVHAAVIDVVQSAGAACNMRGKPLDLPEEPFLCFGRGDPRDVVVGSDKILGSAQRRRRGAILQHGSLLMSKSSLTGNMPGLHDLFPRFREESTFGHQLGAAVAAAISQTWSQVNKIPDRLMMIADSLESNKYDHLTWDKNTIKNPVGPFTQNVDSQH